MNSRIRFLRSLGLCLLFAAALALADSLLGHVLYRDGRVADAVDILSPSTLDAKLAYLRRFSGFKVVLLGDSVVLGQTLEEHGDARWRKHTLARRMEQRFRALYPGRDLLVMNLGMKGALPGDLELLAERLEDCGVDLLVLDVSLRAFSADFAGPEASLSQPWLAEGRGTSADGPEGFLAEAAQRWWGLYRLRDFLQARLLGGAPRSALEHARDALKQGLRKKKSDLDDLDEEMMLAIKVGMRYRSIHLRESHAQRQSLERLLARLAQRGQKTVVFYASENPDRLEELFPSSRYASLRHCLDDVIGRYVSPTLVYVPRIDALEPRHYLDHGHVDAEGYVLMADAIMGRAAPLLP